jgi:hypothetical protein
MLDGLDRRGALVRALRAEDAPSRAGTERALRASDGAAGGTERWGRNGGCSERAAAGLLRGGSEPLESGAAVLGCREPSVLGRWLASDVASGRVTRMSAACTELIRPGRSGGLSSHAVAPARRPSCRRSREPSEVMTMMGTSA